MSIRRRVRPVSAPRRILKTARIDALDAACFAAFALAAVLIVAVTMAHPDGIGGQGGASAVGESGPAAG